MKGQISIPNPNYGILNMPTYKIKIYKKINKIY